MTKSDNYDTLRHSYSIKKSKHGDKVTIMTFYVIIVTFLVIILILFHNYNIEFSHKYDVLNSELHSHLERYGKNSNSMLYGLELSISVIILTFYVIIMTLFIT